jgi:hypothetical protein
VKKWLALFFLLPSVALAAPGQLVDCQTSPQSITTGGTDQTQLAVGSQNTTVWVENYCSATTQNIGSAESLWVNVGAAAAVGTGFELAACGSQVFQLNYPNQQALHVYAATTSHRFACKVNQ